MEYPTTSMTCVISCYLLSWLLTILESIKLLATNFPMNENLAQTLSATSEGVLGPSTPEGTAQLNIGSHMMDGITWKKSNWAVYKLCVA